MNMKSNAALCVELSLIDYEKALNLQRSIVEAKKGERLKQDVLLLLEHNPVFTIGRRGGKRNLMVSEAFLFEKRISLFQVERGGDITYHGPGQLVAYPIMDLKRRKIKVIEFVEKLEEIMIRTARDWDIHAGRDPRNRGVWVENSKLGSIGISVTRGISFHGFALNVNADLEPFTWINPCGLDGITITSIEREIGETAEMGRAVHSVKRHAERLFECRLDNCGLSELTELLQSP